MNEHNAVPDTLDDMGGQRVRWKQRGRWRYGHVGPHVLEQDGSLRVYDDHNGAARALRLTDVERLVRGPRGGTRWAPCELIDTSAHQRAKIQAAERSPGPTRHVRRSAVGL